MGLVVAGVMHLEEIQAQGVGNHAEAGKAHGCGTEHGVQGQVEQRNPHTGSQRDTDDIVNKGPEQVLMDVA